MSVFKKLKAAAAAAALLVAGAANAVLVGSSTNNPLEFSWSYNTGTSLLTGFGTMTISGFNSSLLTVNISLSNTSQLGGQGGERLTAFGFGIDPNATSVSFLDANDGGIDSAALGANFPGYQAVDVCGYGGSTCAGGSNGGIYAGTSDSFAVVLGGTWGDSVNIDPIALKYQTGYGSFEFSTSTTGTPATTGSAPEPGTGSLALLGLGLLGAGFGLRRKQNA